MKCTLTFTAKGSLRVLKVHPLTVRGTTYELVTDANSIVTHIRATVPVTDVSRWPTIHSGPPYTVNPRLPLQFPFIQLELRALQGLLSFWGLEGIDVSSLDLKWTPESDEEKKVLHLFSFKYSTKRADPSKQLPVHFSLVARAVVAAEDALDVELPLSFYRNGLNDVLEGQYIEAIYDFYFTLEHLFGNGATKNSKVCENFQQSDQLTEAILNTLKDPDPGGQLIRELRERFAKFAKEYAEPSAVCAFIVNLRGKLHHHSSKRRNAWHPDYQAQFHFEALLLQCIAFNVLYPMVWGYLESEKVTRTLQVQQDADSSNPGKAPYDTGKPSDRLRDCKVHDHGSA